MRALLLLSLCVGILSGCNSAAPVNYYYGKYSQTLYRSTKDSTPASLAKHKQSLEDVMKTSKTKGFRVPPGIYCEYAYLLAADNDPAADGYFSLEIEAYPESTRFVSFLRSQINSRKS